MPGHLLVVPFVLAVQPTAELRAPEPQDGFGYVSAMPGDVDGDGFADVVVGAPLAAKVYVYAGTAEGPRTRPATVLAGEPGTGFGRRLGPAGDVDGDGFADLLVGDEAGTRLHRGGPEGLAAAPSLVLPEPDCAGVGDVDGDGYDDVAAAGNWLLRLLWGGPGGVAATRSTVSVRAGGHLAAAGDVDGDGFADVLIGDALVYGGPDGLREPAEVLPVAGDGVGGGAGDLDGDGFDDLWYTSSADARGRFRVELLRGGPGGVALDRELGVFDCRIPAEDRLCLLGLARAGDTTGDGADDLLVAAYTDVGGLLAGIVYTAWLYDPGVPDDTGTIRVVASGEDASAFGIGRSGGEDLDADGDMDFVVGGWDDAGEGLVYVFAGPVRDADADGVAAPDDCDDEDPAVGACDTGGAPVDQPDPTLDRPCDCAVPRGDAAVVLLLGLASWLRRRR